MELCLWCGRVSDPPGTLGGGSGGRRWCSASTC